MPAMCSESCTFIWQPSVRTSYVGATAGPAGAARGAGALRAVVAVIPSGVRGPGGRVLPGLATAGATAAAMVDEPLAVPSGRLGRPSPGRHPAVAEARRSRITVTVISPG